MQRKESSMDYGLHGRVALVTAASKGLGKACAIGLAREGARVAICARGGDVLERTAKEIMVTTGAEVFWRSADMAQAEDITRLIDETRAHFGRLDILVTNAGGPPPGYFMDFTDEDWLAALNLNLLSTIRLIRGVLPQMREQHWGRIVNITSVTVKQPLETLILSNVSRAGVVTLSKTLSNQLAKDNVLINTVCPGIILTDRVDQVVGNIATTQGLDKDQALQNYVKPVPMGRPGEPAEFAELVIFLCSERCSYITGTVTQVDGGFVQGYF
jgi:3-oxoacyl-[acyl-carrier protein] reductase